MPILHVRNVPASLYAGLRRLAGAHHRSLTAEVLALLEEQVRREAHREKQGRILDEMERLRKSQSPLPPGVNSVDWIREDRERDDDE